MEELGYSLFRVTDDDMTPVVTVETLRAIIWKRPSWAYSVPNRDVRPPLRNPPSLPATTRRRQPPPDARPRRCHAPALTRPRDLTPVLPPVNPRAATRRRPFPVP